jgi:hypothetical protein
MTALSWDELYAVWRSTTDSNFVQSLELAGNGCGLEAYGQMVEQAARLSLAIARTTQSLYILQHSGQDQSPASGEKWATVQLNLTRTVVLDKPFSLAAGRVWFEEVARDWGEDPGSEGVDVPTGRRFTPISDVTFLPGYSTAVSVTCVAEFPGSSYNNPMPGSIRLVQDFPNVSGYNGALEVVGNSEWFTDLNGEVSPMLTGAYLAFDSGLNAGTYRRIQGVSGGKAILAPSATTVTPDSGITWRVARWSEFGLSCANSASPSGGAIGMLDAIGAERGMPRYANETDDDYRDRIASMSDVVSPNAVPRSVARALKVYGLAPGILREAGMVTLPGIFADVPGNNPSCFDLDAIRVADAAFVGFVEGEQLQQEKPDGTIATGKAAFTNDEFAGIVGIKGTFVEGSEIVGVRSGVPFTPPTGSLSGGLQASDRYRYAFGPGEDRAFFGVVVPQTGAGEFGSGFDDVPGNAFDASFADGYPVLQAKANKAALNAEDAARAAGVGFAIFPY